jgi:hypothetical protein
MGIRAWIQRAGDPKHALSRIVRRRSDRETGGSLARDGIFAEPRCPEQRDPKERPLASFRALSQGHSGRELRVPGSPQRGEEHSGAYKDHVGCEFDRNGGTRRSQLEAIRHHSTRRSLTGLLLGLKFAPDILAPDICTRYIFSRSFRVCYSLKTPRNCTTRPG